MIERYAIKSATPVLYATGCVPVLVGILLAVALLENNPWLGEVTGLYYVGDLVALVALLFIGGLVFGLLEWTIIRLEKLRVPTLLDHFRHCTLLYTGLIFSGFILFSTYQSQAGELGYAYGLAIFVIGAYASAIDALILVSNRRSSNRAERGGAR